MSEAKPQDGSTVKGYRKLSDAEIAAMNRLKELSRNFIRELRNIQLDLLPQDPVLSLTALLLTVALRWRPQKCRKPVCGDAVRWPARMETAK